jgi:hypothetical protein
MSALARVTRKVFLSVDSNFAGCISRPSRNRRKIIPNSEMSVNRVGSQI